MNYILKYITKNIEGGDFDSFIQKVLLWAEFSDPIPHQGSKPIKLDLKQ